MKTTTRLIGVVAIAMALTMVLSAGAAVASPPQPPTPETETINTITAITCIGQVTELEKLNWECSSEDLLNNPPLADQEIVGMIKYKEDLKVTAGATEFVKNLGIDTGTGPNLNVMKSIGYVQGDSIGSLSHDEQVDMSIVADNLDAEDVLLCPFAIAALEDGCIPAACEQVSAGSNMIVTAALATTRTKVTTTEAPVALSYAVDVTGLGGAGTLAIGTVGANLDVFVEDGRDCGVEGGDWAFVPVDEFWDWQEVEPDVWDWVLVDDGDVPVWVENQNYPLGSRLAYQEASTASGLFEFHKSMEYKSVIRP